MRLSQQEFATLLERLARENGEMVDCSVRLVRRWESGQISCPRPVYQRLLEQATGRSLWELGFGEARVATPAGRGLDHTADVDSAAHATGIPGRPGPDGAPQPAAGDPTHRPRRLARLLAACRLPLLLALAVPLTAVFTALVTVGITKAAVPSPSWPPSPHTEPSGRSAGALPQAKIFGPTTLAPGEQGQFYADVPSGKTFYWVVNGDQAGGTEGLRVAIPAGRSSITLTLVYQDPAGGPSTTTHTISLSHP